MLGITVLRTLFTGASMISWIALAWSVSSVPASASARARADDGYGSDHGER